MPVILGDNLTLEDNRLSAVYKKLYTKLNRAYAWTNTQTSGSNGSLSVYINNLNFSNYIPCSNSSFFTMATSDSFDHSYSYILNGEIYISRGLSQLYDYKFGTNTNWKELSISNYSYSSATNYTIQGWAINSLHELYYIYERNNNGTITHNETKIGTDTTWSNLSSQWAINNGKLYYLNTSTATQIGTDTSWSHISKIYFDTYASNYWDESSFWGLNNGYVYKLNSNSATLYQLNTEIKYFLYDGSETLYVDINDDLYSKYGSNTPVYIGNIPNVIKFIPTDVDDELTGIFLTSEGKMGITNRYSNKIFYFNKDIFWKDIIPCSSSSSSEYPWSTICAIGDGKLYFIKYFIDEIKKSEWVYTILNDNNNFQKLYGTFNTLTYPSSSSNNFKSLYAFNSEDELISESTIYTTKHPIVNDNGYNNMDLSTNGKITNVELPNISDNILTYVRDQSKDSFFNKIPPETIHETVSAMDLLNATNPNN